MGGGGAGAASGGSVPVARRGFLADAHEHHGALRRVGAFYQFRHVELQHHPAGTEGEFTTPVPTPTTTPVTTSSAATVPRSRCARSPRSGPPPRRGRGAR
ncbi:hypothetical protein E4K73_12770 [Streptomyces sp. IB201691-2A2]|nr:hypothetical protein E4K73_12770 [Streptomyces sp. IB201691-2A2]